MPVQTATIVVTDLVGSTELRVRVGEEEAERLRRLHDRALTQAAEASGGLALKSLGDGLLVMFAGTSEALGAAVTMQQSIDLLGRDERIALSMRIGISAGDVTVEEGDAFGTPVIEASRLCADAHPDEILVAGHVRYLVRGRGNLAWTPLGQRLLKGLAEPVEVSSLEWERARSRADLRTDTPFVGRASERTAVSDCLRMAYAGRGSLVLVSGEPGIGKSRFVREICDSGGATVLWGTCHDGDALAYGPFVEAFTGWLRGLSVDDALDALGPDAPILARMAPSIGKVVPGIVADEMVPPGEAAGQLQEALCQVLERLSRSRPVVLVLDDLHWGEDATIQCLCAIARQVARMRLLIIVTYRDADLDRRHPLLGRCPPYGVKANTPA